jgi:hypothetical protein
MPGTAQTTKQAMTKGTSVWIAGMKMAGKDG